MLTPQNIVARLLVIAFFAFAAVGATFAGQFTELCNQAPIIVRARIIALEPGAAISDQSKEFVVQAEVFQVAKGKLGEKERIKVVIRLPMREHDSLRDNPFGMKVDGDFIFFLRPQYTADGKTLEDYRFTEIPLGCLPHDFYTWSQIVASIKKANTP
ncbi:MAG: hypothetical protein MUF31_14430 [Akkermansiaceae bacterium]|jgi:hypothetical protein|nr:hypothetical protein [Akkermansiaceae bacterium]